MPTILYGFFSQIPLATAPPRSPLQNSNAVLIFFVRSRSDLHYPVWPTKLRFEFTFVSCPQSTRSHTRPLQFDLPDRSICHACQFGFPDRFHVGIISDFQSKKEGVEAVRQRIIERRKSQSREPHYFQRETQVPHKIMCNSQIDEGSRTFRILHKTENESFRDAEIEADQRKFIQLSCAVRKFRQVTSVLENRQKILTKIEMRARQNPRLRFRSQDGNYTFNCAWPYRQQRTHG